MKMIKSVFFLNINLLVGIVLIHTGCKENDKSTSPKVPTYNMPQSNEPTKPKKPQPSVEWSYIPSGSFIMGSSIYEANRLPDENQHQVILSAFKMSKNEVTFEQYDKVQKLKGVENISYTFKKNDSEYFIGHFDLESTLGVSGYKWGRIIDIHLSDLKSHRPPKDFCRDLLLSELLD